MTVSDRVEGQPEIGRRTRGGADARRALRQKPKIVQNPYIVRKIPLVTILDEEGLQLIERNADTILQEIGIEFRDEPEAVELWKQAGADVKGTRIRFSPRPLPLDHPEIGAQGIHPACPQSGALGPDRRRRHRVRAGLWPAVHPQSR